MKSLILATIVPAFCGIQFLHGGENGWKDLEKRFNTLPMEARRLTGPLFWMHGDETPAQLTGELQNVLDGGNGTFTAESRPHKDWLGEGWYRDLAVNLDFARKNDLTMFIFDDWWWPSQMMGGRVPPEFGTKVVVASAVRVEGPMNAFESDCSEANLIAVVAGKVLEGGAVDGASLVDLTSRIEHGKLVYQLPAGSWSVMKFTWKFKGKGGGQQKYISVDGASPEAVDWFIKAVYQPHFDRFGADFGKTITGYFYDEPETQGDWGSDVPKLIAERNLSLAKLLVGYKFKLAGEEQSAANYSYLDAFAESWGRTMYGGMARWCRDHKVVSMGHFMEHGDLLYNRSYCAGNLMQLQKYSDMGGIDLVCRQLYPGERKMSVYQTPKIASSVSHTYHKTDDIAFSEIYGGYNQELTYPEMKWLADWHQVRGVNFLIPHSFNPRAPYDKDYPPYFNNGGQEPRWPLYRIWADYTSRLSLMLTGGRHVCPVAFLQPGQSYHVGKTQRPEEFTSVLQDALFDSDWLLYDAWENDSKLVGNTIQLHKEDYKVLVLPATEVIPYPTLVKARSFFENGGVVVAYDRLPSQSATLGYGSNDIMQLCNDIWGNASPSLSRCKTSKAGGRSYFLPAKPTSAEIRKVFVEDAGIHPTLEVMSGETNNWLHVLHRRKDEQDVFLVCNQNHQGAARKFTFRVTARGEPESWDPMRNEVTSIPYRRIDEGRVELDLTLEPAESVLLVFAAEKRNLPARRADGMKPKREIPLRNAGPTENKTPAGKPVVLNATSNGKHFTVSPVTADPFTGSCGIPADLNLAESRVFLEVEDLSPEAAASVSVNGQPAGGFIGKPLRLDVTRFLKSGDNTIRLDPFRPKSARLVVY